MYEGEILNQVQDYESYDVDTFDDKRHDDSADEENEMSDLESENLFELVADKRYDDKADFVSVLKWLRWKIYSKLSDRNLISYDDINRYEDLVRKFVDKFQKTQLKRWEVSIWLKKIKKTREDFDHAMINHLEDVKNEEIATFDKKEDERKASVNE